MIIFQNDKVVLLKLQDKSYLMQGGGYKTDTDIQKDKIKRGTRTKF